MNYLIGLDGGGTKTKCIIADSNFKILYECTGGPSNFLLADSESVSKTLFQLIEECKNSVSCEFENIISVVLGTTGAGRRTDAETLENSFIKYIEERKINLNKFRVESDARIALEGAFAGKPGSILIAGTGSIMFGKDKDGEIHRVGGFGRFIGDEGSGYMIGRRGLIAVAKHLDGRGLSTNLTRIIKEEFQIHDVSSLITEIYKNNFDIASVTPLVISAAENGDEICDNILNDESEELILHIRSMKKLLNEEILNLCLVGSTLTTNNYYSTMFKSKVQMQLLNVIIAEAKYEPAMGAVLMAKELIH